MSDSESDENVYEVERITNHVIYDGITYYYVHWKGYEGPEAETWEPKENLLSCEDLLNSYIASHPPKTSKSDRSHGITDDSSSESSSDRGSTYRHQHKGFGQEKKTPVSGRGRGRGKGRARGRGRGRGGRQPARESKPARKSSSSGSNSRSGSSSDESPHVKDPFWENLEKGKIDVFAGDLYSKVKRRRGSSTGEPRTTIPSVNVSRRGSKKKPVSEDIIEKHKNDNEDIVADDELKQKSNEPDSRKEEEKSTSQNNIADDSSNESSDHSHSGFSSPVLDYLEEQLDQSRKSKPKRQKTAEKSQKAKTLAAKEKNVVKDVQTSELDYGAKSKSIKEAVKSKLIKQSEKSKLKEKFDNRLDEKLSGNESKKSDQSEDSDSSPDLPPAPLVHVGRKKEKKSEEAKVESDKEEMLEVGGDTRKDYNKASAFSDLLQELDCGVPTIVPRKKDKKRSLKIRSPSTEKQPSSSLKTTPKSDKFEKQQNVSDDASTLEVSTKPIRENEKEKVLAKLQIKERTTGEKSTPIKRKTRLSSPEKAPISRSQSTPSQSQNKRPQDDAKEKPSTSRSSSFSVFEAMEEEFGAESAAKNKPARVESKSRTPSREEPECENVDMSEYLKVKVNFSLDEVTLKDIELHHDSGEPPCRVGREISNAEFRQFIRSNNYEMVFEVLKAKGRMYNLEHQDSMWMTQLMIAAAAGFTEIVKVLAYHGARVNARTKSNQTALMFAAEKGHAITVRILLMYGAYVNLQTTSGETALMKAAKAGHLEIAHCLLQAGADPCLKSSHGVSALTMEGRISSSTVALVRKHKQNVDAAVDACVRNTVAQLGLKVHGSSVFGVRTYNVRECPLVYFTFSCNLQDLPPNQGLMLFAVHGMVGPGLSVKCRMRGPCHVSAVTVNNAVMEPLMPTKESDKYSYFMTNVIWRNGQNSFRLFVVQDGLSREKLYLAAYVLGFT